MQDYDRLLQYERRDTKYEGAASGAAFSYINIKQKKRKKTLTK